MASKRETKRERRKENEHLAEANHAVDEWGDLDEFSARASTLMLRRLDENETADGFSWIGETLTGEPMPDVAAAVRRSRESH